METLPYTFNSTSTCYIHPRLPSFPTGLLLNFNSCPDVYNNNTKKLIRWCCIGIITNTLNESVCKKIQNFLTYYGSTVLVLPAIFFNLLSLFVLISFKRQNNSTSTSFYMKYLCIFDTLTILSKFMHETIVTRNSIRAHPIPFNSVFCKIDHFIESVFAITSIYILIAMSFDKLICVLTPLRVNTLLTTRKARITCSFIVISAIAYSSQHFYIQRVQILESRGMGYDSANNETGISNTTLAKRIVYDCDSHRPDITFELKLIDNIIRVFIPIILLITCNTTIVIGLARAQKSTIDILYANSVKSSEPQSNAKRDPSLTTSQLLVSNQRPSTASRLGHISTYNEKAKKNSNYILIMLFAVCFGFVILNLPFALRNIFERKFREKFQILDYLYHSENTFSTEFTRQDIIKVVQYEFFSFFSHFLVDLNYVANFFLYFLSGSRFRSKLFSMSPFRTFFKQNYTHSVSFYSTHDVNINHVMPANQKCCNFLRTSRRNTTTNGDYNLMRRCTHTNLRSNRSQSMTTSFLHLDTSLHKSCHSIRKDQV